MCCPLRSTNKRLEDFRERPKMFNIWLKIGWGYLATHPTGEPAKKYGDVYEWLYRELFYKAWKNWKTGFFKNEKIDFKQLLYNKLNKTTNYGKQQLLPSVLSHNPTLVREQLIPIVKLVDAIIQEEKPAILRPDSEEGKEDKA